MSADGGAAAALDEDALIGAVPSSAPWSALTLAALPGLPMPLDLALPLAALALAEMRCLLFGNYSDSCQVMSG